MNSDLFEKYFFKYLWDNLQNITESLMLCLKADVTFNISKISFWILENFPADIYLLKVNNRNTNTRTPLASS